MSGSDFNAGGEERTGKAGAPGHVELPVDLAQVVVNGGRAEEQLGGDIPVGGPGGGQPGDLSLLRGEARAVLAGAPGGPAPASAAPPSAGQPARPAPPRR